MKVAAIPTAQVGVVEVAVTVDLLEEATVNPRYNIVKSVL